MTLREHDPAAGSVQEAVSPSSPGLPPESGVAIDLGQVAPSATSSTRLLVLVGAGSAILFGALTASVGLHVNAVSAADLQVHSWVLVSRDELTIGMARWLTWGGATIITLPALFIIGALASPRGLALRSRIGSGALLAGVASLCVYVGLLVNRAVGGARPVEGDWAGDAGGPSFPSGHTTAATVLAAFALWALATHVHTTPHRVGLVAAAAAYAGIVGMTRVWLGVHWPTDVLGGSLYGVASSSLAIAAVLALRRRRRQ